MSFKFCLNNKYTQLRIFLQISPLHNYSDMIFENKIETHKKNLRRYVINNIKFNSKSLLIQKVISGVVLDAKYYYKQLLMD